MSEFFFCCCASSYTAADAAVAHSNKFNAFMALTAEQIHLENELCMFYFYFFTHMPTAPFATIIFFIFFRACPYKPNCCCGMQIWQKHCKCASKN